MWGLLNSKIFSFQIPSDFVVEHNPSCSCKVRSNSRYYNILYNKNTSSDSMEIKKYLKEKRINFKEFSHNPVYTVEDTKKEGIYEKIKGIHSKNLFLKERKSRRFYLVVMQENKPLNIKELEEKLKYKLKFANPENLKEILGLTPGSVSPFGLINDKINKTILLIDKDVWNADFVSFHPNINTETLQLSKENFHKYVNSLKNEMKIIEQ